MVQFLVAAQDGGDGAGGHLNEKMTAELELTRSLDSLSSEELDHVSLGLTHAFGASLAGVPATMAFGSPRKAGQLIALSKLLTLSDVWSAANASCL